MRFGKYISRRARNAKTSAPTTGRQTAKQQTANVCVKLSSHLVCRKIIKASVRRFADGTCNMCDDLICYSTRGTMRQRRAAHTHIVNNCSGWKQWTVICVAITLYGCLCLLQPCVWYRDAPRANCASSNEYTCRPATSERSDRVAVCANLHRQKHITRIYGSGSLSSSSTLSSTVRNESAACGTPIAIHIVFRCNAPTFFARFVRACRRLSNRARKTYTCWIRVELSANN